MGEIEDSRLALTKRMYPISLPFKRLCKIAFPRVFDFINGVGRGHACVTAPRRRASGTDLKGPWGMITGSGGALPCVDKN